jgi:hypothetical protein
MRRVLVVLAATLLVACASAGKPGNKPDGGGGDDDASNIDAPTRIDGSGMMVTSTLQEPTSTNVTSPNTVNCHNGLGETAENHYYRAFLLSDFSITSDFHVTQVTFAVETAQGGPQTATVKVGTYSGAITAATTTLTPAMITNIAQATSPSIPDGTNGTVVTPVDAMIPASSTILVEIMTPNHVGDGIELFPGSNNSGEKKPSFFSTPDSQCAITGIKSYANLGAPQVQLIISVTGTHT